MKRTKRIALAMFAYLMSLMAWAQTEDMSQYMPKLSVGTVAPEIILPKFEGEVNPNPVENDAKLSDFRGNYVLVDFWATWCGDCRREMPIIREALDPYKDHVKVLSVNFDTKPEYLTKYMEKNPTDWTVVADFTPWKESAVTQAYELGWIPTFYLIDPQGVIVGSGITGEQLKDVLERIFPSGSNN